MTLCYSVKEYVDIDCSLFGNLVGPNFSVVDYENTNTGCTVVHVKYDEKLAISIPSRVNYRGTVFLCHNYVIQCWKRIGETPYTAMRRIRREYGIPFSIKGCYAGRLDPLAQGIMHLLFGSSMTKKSTEYCKKDKTYEFCAILGFSTRSYDPLSIIEDSSTVTEKMALKYLNQLKSLSGKTFMQKYPPYSGLVYKGKPLWLRAKNNTLPVPMPAAERRVHNMEIISSTEIPVREYIKDCTQDIEEVDSYSPGNQFDCPSVIDQWNKIKCPGTVWKIICRAHVSSGTFVRSLVHDTGILCGIPAHAFRITRVSTQ